MRPTTEKIRQTIEQIRNLPTIYELNQKAEENGWPTEFQEYSIEEAVGMLEQDLDLLLDAIRDETLDQYSRPRRERVLSQLSHLSQYISGTLNNNENRINDIITHITQLRDEMLSMGIEFKLSRYPAFPQKKRDLTNLLNLARDAVHKSADADQYIKKAKDAQNDINTLKENLEQYVEDVQRKLKNVSKSDDDAQALMKEIVTKESNISKLNDNANDIVVSLGNFNKQVDKYLTYIDSSQKSTDEIINKNQELQNQVLDLLGKANAGNLFKAFDTKAKSVGRWLIFWAFSILLSLVGFFILGIWIVNAIGNDISIVNNQLQISAFFIFKLLLSIPLAYGLIFFTRQYEHYKQMQDEYSFRSTVSLSLVAYREQLEQLETTKPDSPQIELLKDIADRVFSPIKRRREVDIEDNFLKKILSLGKESTKMLKEVKELVSNPSKKELE